MTDNNVRRLRRAVAEVLVRSKLDVSGPIVMANAFLGEMRGSTVLTACEIAAYWKEFLTAEHTQGHLFGLYMHFPYCSSRCLYCFTPARVLPARDAPARYVENSLQEARFFARLFKNQLVHFWSVGGGTPSLLDVRGLRKWLEPVAHAYSFAEDGLRSVELNPASTSLAKLLLLKSLGFNRVSFGVQTLNQDVLRAVRREYQNYSMVRRAIQWAQAAGFQNINADLIFGLAGETPESFFENFRMLAGLRPSMIVVSPLVLTDGYMRATGMTRGQRLRSVPAFFPEVRENILGLAAQNGYRAAQFEPGGSYWVFLAAEVSDSVFAQWEKHSSDCGPPSRSTLGLGWHSKSRLFGRASYGRERGVFTPDRPLYKLSELSTKEEMAQHILYVLDRRSRIDYASFQRCFGRDVRDEFGMEFAALGALGAIRGDDSGCSFLPQRAPERLLYGLFFLLETLARSPFAGREFDGLYRRAQADLRGAGVLR